MDDEFDDHIGRPAIHNKGLEILANVTPRLRMALRYADCWVLEVIFHDDKGTPNEPQDDESHILEFDECLSRRDIPGVLAGFAELLLDELAQVGTGRTINEGAFEGEGPDPLPLIINDITTKLIAKSSTLDIEFRPEEGDVLVELTCGFYRAHAVMSLDTALDFFSIDTENVGAEILGEPNESPIGDVEDDEVDEVLSNTNPNS